MKFASLGECRLLGHTPKFYTKPLLSAVNFVMRGIFLANSVQSFLNAEKYVIISKYYLGENTLL